MVVGGGCGGVRENGKYWCLGAGVMTGAVGDAMLTAVRKWDGE